MRDLRARDIVIGQVGMGANNVIIGKNNVQVNIGGRSLILPIYTIALALLVILSFLAHTQVEPRWNPNCFHRIPNIFQGYT